MDHNVGDVIFFSSFGHVYEGTVIEAEGPFIRLSTRCPGTEWIMSKKAFKTSKELLESEYYSRDYYGAKRLEAARMSCTGL